MTNNFPQNIPTPAFQVGLSRVRWKQMPDCDWGLVTGMQYLWAEHLNSWQWRYHVVLDASSPSFQWIQSDWGWQDDLELLPADESRSA